MFKKIVALLLGLQFLTFTAGATPKYGICALPDAVTVANTDHFELSRACGGSRNATAAELATYILGKAPGSSGQLVFNSAGVFTAAPASTSRNLLGLATVATSGSYLDLLNRPALATVATSGNYLDLQNRPTIPAAQVNADWNGTGVAQILNKPALGSLAALSSVNNGNWSGTPLSIANGGTGTSSPGLIAGANVSATGSWPTQTVSATASGNTGDVQYNSGGRFTAVSGSGLLRLNGTAPPTIAVSGQDYAPACATGAVNAQSGNYILQATDTNCAITETATTASIVTIPANATVPFAVNSQVMLIQTGTGQTTVSAAGGVTMLNSMPTSKLRTRNSAATLLYLGSDTWLVSGDMASQ